MNALEIAAGVPLRPTAPASRLPRATIEPSEALRRAVVPALRRPPCIVSFSGGRDSSLVLAAAVGAARSEGLSPPVPFTVRFRDAPAAGEEAWQEGVVRHLGVGDWIRVEVGDELDCIGEIAQPVLLRHGVLWPANTHFHAPHLERAALGTLVTGIGGDEVFSPSGWKRLRTVASGGAAPEARDLLRLGAALAPHALRRRVIAARSELELCWLRPGARQQVLASLAAEAAAEPVRWRQRLGWVIRLGYLRAGTEALAALAADHDAAVAHPFLDVGFVASIAALPRSRRFEDRTAGLVSLFADLLPEEILSRRTKAVFSNVLWGSASRAFAASWSGDGVDRDLVDVDALKRRWQVEGEPGPHTLLQAIWLSRRSSRGQGPEQALERGR